MAGGPGAGGILAGRTPSLPKVPNSRPFPSGESPSRACEEILVRKREAFFFFPRDLGRLLVDQRGIAAATITRAHARTPPRAGTVDPAAEANVKAKLEVLVARRGGELEALLRARDTERSGEIPVKAFSECLRAWDAVGGGGGGGSGGDGANRLGRGSEGLTHAERKVLYRRWAVKKWVRYEDFLTANGYHDEPLPRYSQVSTAIPADLAANSKGASAVAAAATPARLPHSGKRSSSNAPRSAVGRGSTAGALDTGTTEKGEGAEEERALLARARVVFVRLSEVSSRQGQRRASKAETQMPPARSSYNRHHQISNEGARLPSGGVSTPGGVGGIGDGLA